MGQDKRAVTVYDEDILNLKHCLERTSSMWTPFTDLWPFTIKGIIERWESAKSETDDSWEKYPDRMGGQFTEEEIKRSTESRW